METKRIGLTTKSIKSEYMVASRDIGRPSGVGGDLVFNGYMLEVVPQLANENKIRPVALYGSEAWTLKKPNRKTSVGN